MCKHCETNPVYKQESGRKLCKKCFSEYYERKVFRTIRKHELLDKEDKIGVACSGGKDSTTLLYLLNRFAESNRMQKPEALAIDEGIHGYRNKTLEDLKNFCENNKVKLHIFSFKKEFGFSLDEALVIAQKKKLGINSCYICGILRKY